MTLLWCLTEKILFPCSPFKFLEYTKKNLQTVVEGIDEIIASKAAG
jgi:hypothetical protein